MTSKVLWVLDSELEAQAFERLCLDLLYRSGFKDIVPVEPQDGGRDAEEHPRVGRGRDGEAAFFQFSLEQNWKAKIRRDAKKLSAGGFKFQTLVFVTSSKVRGVDRDAITKELSVAYGWKFIVFSRAWLRLQLEEAHPDLAKKYLDIDFPSDTVREMKLDRLDPPEGHEFREAWRVFEAGRFERAAVMIKEVMELHPEPNCRAYTALAWSQYQTHRYDEALRSINRAITMEDSGQVRGIRACILVEKGIATRDRISLIEGKKLFERLVADAVAPVWCNLYNLGNAQSALGKHQAAIVSYKGALKERPDHVETLKNLGSAYHRVGEHELEMECLDRALELDPLKWEGLVSKAVSLMIDFNQPSAAVDLLELALKWDAERATTWPHVWYWLAEARVRSGNSAAALSALDEGLQHQPGHRAMWRLKSNTLQVMAASDPSRVSEAEAFWRERLSIAPSDYSTRERLMRLRLRKSDDDGVWELLDGYLRVVGLRVDVSVRDWGFPIEDCIVALRFTRQYLVFRRLFPVSGYWSEADPLYDLGFPPPLTSTVQHALLMFALVPFGLGFASLEASSDNPDAVQRLRNVFDLLRELLTKAVAHASEELASFVSGGPESRDDLPDRFAQALIFVGLVGLREFGRQRGWVSSQFPISRVDLNLALDGYDETKIEKDVAVSSLSILNDVLKLFPE